MDRHEGTKARRHEGKESGLFPFLLVCIALVLVTGCAKPNKANIELRKQNADMRSQVESLQRQHEADVASIAATEKRGTTVPSLPNERVSQLFTVNGLQFGRLTGVDPDKPGLKVYVVPTDSAGEAIKAAGSFAVDAFDLSARGDTRVGHWEFPLADAAKNWFGKATLYTYVLPLPVEKLPEHGEITLKVTFTDALTGREFTAQKEVQVKPQMNADERR